MTQAVQYLNTLSPRVRQVIYLVFILAYIAAYGTSAAYGTDPNWLATGHRVLEALSPFALGLAVTHVTVANADAKVEVSDVKVAPANAGHADEDLVEVDEPTPTEVD